MNNLQKTSFGIYEAFRIIIPGLYFASLCYLFTISFISRYISLEFSDYSYTVFFILLVLVSGLTMYAKETPKRRRAFIENQPSTFLQNISRRSSTSQILNDDEAKHLYFYILNNHVPAIFHDKIFFFGTVYHIMIQLRRITFWFAIISVTFLIFQYAGGIQLQELQNAILFYVLILLVYLLNVKYNKADRKMQENYQDQIFWLQMNEQLILDLVNKYDASRKGIIR